MKNFALIILMSLIMWGCEENTTIAEPMDGDDDGISDSVDNCDNVPNPTQENADGDNFGDACDNCPSVATVLNDPCPDDEGPADADGDGIPDDTDNCPDVANGDQADRNNNQRGDACDDTDADGHVDLFDNCPDDFNPGQEDSDGDNIGDMCDVEEVTVASLTTNCRPSLVEARIDCRGRVEDDQGFERDECAATWRWDLLEGGGIIDEPKFSQEVSFFPSPGCGTYSVRLHVDLADTQSLVCLTDQRQPEREVEQVEIIVDICPSP